MSWNKPTQRAFHFAGLIAVACGSLSLPSGRAQHGADTSQAEAGEEAAADPSVDGSTRGAAAPGAVSSAGEPPWPERRRPELNVYQREEVRVGPTDWGPVAEAPSDVDAARFAAAFRTLCGGMRERTSVEVTGWLLSSARAFHVDPFLLGGWCTSRAAAAAENSALAG